MLTTWKNPRKNPKTQSQIEAHWTFCYRFEFPDNLDLSEFLKPSDVRMEVDGDKATEPAADGLYVLHAVLVSGSTGAVLIRSRLF